LGQNLRKILNLQNLIPRTLNLKRIYNDANCLSLVNIRQIINRTKVKVRIQQFVMEIITPLREITCNMGSHSVTCHPAAMTFPPLPQTKLVLNLATPEGRKAELTWVVVIFQDSLPAKDGYLSQK